MWKKNQGFSKKWNIEPFSLLYKKWINVFRYSAYKPNIITLEFLFFNFMAGNEGTESVCLKSCPVLLSTSPGGIIPNTSCLHPTRIWPLVLFCFETTHTITAKWTPILWEQRLNIIKIAASSYYKRNRASYTLCVYLPPPFGPGWCHAKKVIVTNLLGNRGEWFNFDN